VRPSTEDIGNKLRTSQSNRHSLSVTQPGTAGAERPRPRLSLAATSPSPVPAEAVVNSAPTVTVPAVSNTRQDLGASAQGARAAEQPESPHRKDWSKVPLPPNWGRKFHKELGRVRKLCTDCVVVVNGASLTYSTVSDLAVRVHGPRDPQDAVGAPAGAAEGTQN
jgi:hypothetical protein